MKKVVAYLFKCIIAGIISAVILTLFSYVYYNPPVATLQPDYITNYKFIPDTNWSYMLEGFGYGKTDKLGYNNSYYKDDVHPDIVFTGSSYIEALQVPHDSNCVYLLNKKFAEDSISDNDFKCFNLGISGHFFEVSSSNFEFVAKKFCDAKYVVIETAKVEFSSSELDAIIEERYHAPMEDKGLIHKLARKNPYMRLMHKKINEVMSVNTESNAENNTLSASGSDNINIYNTKMDKILSRISRLSYEKGFVPVILMHERFFPDGNGGINSENSEIYKNAFVKCCENNNIKVIDTLPAMISDYRENLRLSYGYSNGVPGQGHLNKNGHRIISEVLYEKINEMEGVR